MSGATPHRPRCVSVLAEPKLWLHRRQPDVGYHHFAAAIRTFAEEVSQFERLEGDGSLRMECRVLHLPGPRIQPRRNVHRQDSGSRSDPPGDRRRYALTEPAPEEGIDDQIYWPGRPHGPMRNADLRRLDGGAPGGIGAWSLQHLQLDGSPATLKVTRCDVTVAAVVPRSYQYHDSSAVPSPHLGGDPRHRHTGPLHEHLDRIVTGTISRRRHLWGEDGDHRLVSPSIGRGWYSG